MISPTQGTPPDNTQHSQETEYHDSSGIRTRYPIKWTAAKHDFRPNGHRDDICKYSVLKMKQDTRMLCKLSYKDELPNYFERFIKTLHDRLRIKKCCKISTKYPFKNIFIKHPKYFTVLSFVLKCLKMLDRRKFWDLSWIRLFMCNLFYFKLLY
jgi:hypothetical protein